MAAHGTSGRTRWSAGEMAHREPDRIESSDAFARVLLHGACRRHGPTRDGLSTCRIPHGGDRGNAGWQYHADGVDARAAGQLAVALSSDRARLLQSAILEAGGEHERRARRPRVA